MEKSKRLYTRVTSQEKSKIEQLAVKCGLSQSEYLRRRALGFVPKEVQPGAFFDFCAKLDELYNLCTDKVTAETEKRLLSLADDIHRTFLQTEKESISGEILSTKRRIIKKLPALAVAAVLFGGLIWFAGARDFLSGFAYSFILWIVVKLYVNIVLHCGWFAHCEKAWIPGTEDMKASIKIMNFI